MLALLKKIVFAIVVLVLVLVGYQNADTLSVETTFKFDFSMVGYSWESPKFPVVLLYGLFFVLGLITAGFHGIYERLARKAEIRRRDKRIRGLEAEAEKMRSRLAELQPPPAPAPEPATDSEMRRIEAPAVSEDDAPTL